MAREATEQALSDLQVASARFALFAGPRSTAGCRLLGRRLGAHRSEQVVRAGLEACRQVCPDRGWPTTADRWRIKQEMMQRLDQYGLPWLVILQVLLIVLPKIIEWYFR